MAKVGNQAEMPFLEHLEELRWRLMWSGLALVITVAASFVVLLKYDAIQYLAAPVLHYLPEKKLIFTHPAAAFKVTMSAAFAMGAVLSSPVIFYHIWAFLSPALHKHEKRVVIPVLIFGLFLFLGGVALAFFALIPLTLRFLLGVQSTVITPMISANEYFGFALSFSMIMGAVFEMPI